jgi:hypothetical protein
MILAHLKPRKKSQHYSLGNRRKLVIHRLGDVAKLITAENEIGTTIPTPL